MSLRTSLADALGAEVAELGAIGGGDLNDAYRARLGDGADVFVKTRADADPEEYAVEAAALCWLAVPGGARTPEVAAVGGDQEAPFLALEWIDPGRLDADGAAALGRALAVTHRAGAAGFGSRPEGAEDSRLHIGPLAFDDRPAGSWAEFYAEQRLIATARIARDRDALSREGAAVIDRVCHRLDELAGSDEPPARLHGDLWSGNVMAAGDGEAVLIDPASYGGHREVDLAMLRLFGAPDERIFSAYEDEFPLADGAAERVALWQLFPLLVHAALFGFGWGERAAGVARRYA